MHLYRCKRAQKWLLNTIAKFDNLGCCYKVVGGTAI